MIKSIFLVLILILFSCQGKEPKKVQNAELSTETEIIKPHNLVLKDTIVYFEW